MINGQPEHLKIKEIQISENFLVIYTRSGYSHSVDRKAISSILKWKNEIRSFSGVQ